MIVGPPLFLLTLTFVTTAAFAQSWICGTQEPPPLHKQAHHDLAQAARDSFSIMAATEMITVDVVFHVLMSGSSVDQGNIPQSQLEDQMSVINDNYAPSKISFNLTATTRTLNERYFNDRAERQMKTELRQGDYKTLNVYFNVPQNNSIGYCYFPVANPSTTELHLDGCTVMHSTVPGGSFVNYNQGKTLTHEAGHWFGLYHTFQGGCNDKNGDFIDDTPAEASPASGCPTGRDSCPRKAGLDPINDYMDYSYDSCLTQFTPGQTTRMHQMYEMFRA